MNMPMELPRCTQGRQMVLRPTNKQTAEQLFCGVWYDCEHCKESVLFMSQELQSQLSAFSHQPARVPTAVRRARGRRGPAQSTRQDQRACVAREPHVTDASEGEKAQARHQCAGARIAVSTEAGVRLPYGQAGSIPDKAHQ